MNAINHKKCDHLEHYEKPETWIKNVPNCYNCDQWKPLDGGWGLCKTQGKITLGRGHDICLGWDHDFGRIINDN